MTFSRTIRATVGYKWIAILLFTCLLSLLTATPAQAQSSVGCVAYYGGLIDGNVNPFPNSHIDIDGNCVIRNFPASNPFTSNVSFFGNNPTSWLVIFDNVVFTGNMSCDKSQGNFIWFTNGSISGLKPNCQNLFLPEEKINKQNPPGPPLATIGVPFTYKMTIPVLFDPLTGTVINNNGSPNDLHDITITDDLNFNATGADLSYVNQSEKVYWLSSGLPVPHTFSYVGGVLTFGGFPVVPAGQQFVIEVTVVLNDTTTNIPGKQFVNTAKWQFGRLIGGVFYEPLPGEWGVTPPMTIVGPALVVRKSGPATMSQGQWGNFAVDVQNTGNSDAWNVSVRDLLPHGATGGMCNLTPGILSAQVFLADGVTPVPGKGPLNQGSDYSLSYSAAPNCQLDIIMLTASGRIGPNERLIVHYQTQLDANTQSGATLTNVAGAIQWFNGDSSISTRKMYTGVLTNGTPGILDNQDAFTVTVAAIADPTLVLTKSGPATLNLGQSGNFAIDVQNIGQADAWNVSLRDLLPHVATGGMCDVTPVIQSAQVFAADGVTPVAGKGLLNSGSDYSLSYSAAPNCQLNITMLTAAGTISTNQHLIIRYRAQLDANTQNGATLTNIAGAIQWFNADSSNASRKTYTGPLTNGTPGVPDNQDAFTVTVAAAASDPALVVTKSGPATMNLGQSGNFAIDVQNTGQSDAWNVSLRDLLPHVATGGMCDVTPVIQSAQVFAADGVTPVAGKGLLNSGSDYSLSYSAAPNCQLNITMLTAAGTISTNQHLIIRYRAQLDANTQNGATLTNIAGAIQWFNADSSNASRKTYTGPLTNGTPGVPDNQDAFTVTVAAAASDPTLVLTKSGPATLNLGQTGNFAIDVQNTGQGDAWNVSLRDLLPHVATGGMCDVTPVIQSAQVFAADGVTPVAGKGPLNSGSDYSLSYSAAPNCQLNITMLTAAGTISTNQHLILRYQAQLDANTQNGATLTNIAGAIQWFNADSSNASRKTYTGPLTNGTPGIPDNQDAFTVTVAAAASDPALVVTKSGPATMNLGQWGNFSIDVQNTSLGDAWNVSLRDLLPHIATGGMCNLTPEILSAQVFAADGVTPVAGKGPLSTGSDYSLSYSAAPNCQLDITMLTAAGRIGPNEHLIFRYRTQLDAGTQNGLTLTNIAGAIQWFNGDSSNTSRKTYTGPLTNGTPGIPDNQDAFTVTVGAIADPALVVTKSGPATLNLGQTGNFAIDVQNTGQSDAWNVSLRDLLPHVATGGMCDVTPTILSAQVFAADGVTPVAGKGPLNSGSDYSLSYSAAPNCQLNITMLTAAGTISTNQHLILRYQAQLDANTQNGATLTNIAGAIQWFNADSSNASRKTYTGPLSNGTPGIPDNQDAFTVTVGAIAGPALVVTKSGPATMNLGQWGNFSIDVQNTSLGDAWNVSLRDLLPHIATGGMCNLTPEILSAQVFAADGVTPVAGKGPLSTGSDYSLSYSAAPNCQLDITMLTAAGRIGPNEHLIFRYRTQLDAGTQNGLTLTNIAGAIQWFNGDSSNTSRKTYSGPLTNGTPGIPDNQDAFTVTVGAIADPALVVTKSGPATMNLGQTGNFTIDVQNTGQSDAWNVSLRDLLPHVATGGMCDVTPVIQSAQVFAADGVTPVAGKSPLNSGSDYSLSYSAAPNCQLNITMLTAAGTISTNQHLILRYQAQLDANTQNGATLTNIAGAIQWFNADSSNASRKTYSGPLTNGTSGIPDNQDAFTVTVGTVAGPALVVTKSGPATMNLGQWGNFTIDVQNTSLGDAWNVSLRDLLPHLATGGMCNLTPEILSAQVFAADGVTPVTGKGPLNAGTDYSRSYTAAPNCQLDITMLTAAGRIGPNEHLIFRYRTQLDAGTQNGLTLTNIAGAIQWFNGDSSNTSRKTYTGPLTNGTPGIPDNQDAFTVTVALAGYFFDKTVANLTSGVNPATTAVPGDKLRYTLRFRTTGQAVSNFSIVDEMDALNAQADFAAGTLMLVTSPAGADTSGTSSTGGTKGTGVIDIRNLSLPATGEALIQFDIALKAAIANGTVVSNQATLLANGTTFWSDDPNVNGTAPDPRVPGGEDPTRVTIVASSVFRVQKVSTYLRDPNVLLAGDTMRYTITVDNISNADAMNVVLRDAMPANTAYVAGSTTLNGVAVADVAGVSPLVNGMRINSPANTTPGLMPSDTSNNQANVATITFNVVVNPNTPNGTILSNQGFVSATGIVDQPSDDPRTPVPNDPTRDIVGNRPPLYAEKHVALFTDLSSPGIVDPGDVLRYTITVKNSATTPATGVALTDPIPANTTYVANSTLLNGSPVPDGGGFPLASGINVGTISPNTTAVLQYDLRVNPGTPSGTQISNQAAVSSAGQPNLLTDSDGNPANGPQPTVVVVGVAQQLSISGQVSVVGGGPALPGAQLDYVYNIVNTAAVPAYSLVFTDDLNGTQPGQLAYVNGSATVNGSAAGVSFAGSTITSNYGALNGPLAPGAVVVLKFRTTLSPSLALGTVVTNTGVATWNNPSQMASASVSTSIVVGSVPGAGQQLAITNQVSVVGGGPAVTGAQLDYVLSVMNIGTVPASNVVISDDLNGTQPGQLAYVNQSATVNGSAAGVSFAGSTITANFGAVNGTLAPGATVVLRFRATLNSSLALGTVVTNTGVAAWDSPTQTVSASVSITVGGGPGFAVLSGSAWYDANFDSVQNSAERALTSWTVELYRDNQLSQSVQTDANGVYRISNVAANDTTGVRYELRFRAPGAGPNTALLGRGVSPFTNGLQRISDIVVPSGANLQGLNLAIHPNGVLYNSMSRVPVVGATLNLLNARSSSPLPAACFDDAAQQGQITLADGYYKFDINFSDPACSSGGDYLIGVTPPPGTNYVSGYSQIIPPASTASTAAFSVSTCPGSAADAIPGTAQFCEVQPSEFAPAATVQPRSAGTTYYVHLMLDGSQIPGSSQIFNNHIPLDPLLLGLLTVTKTTSVVNVSRGQLVPYTITANNHSGQLLSDVSIVDRLPAGFSYIKGSALLDGVPTEPSVVGTALSWNGLVIAGNQVRTVKVLLAVGAGNNQGEYVNHAQALLGVNGNALSGEATATVRLVPDPTFDCTDVMGKVFNDKNRNGRQEDGEEGLAGVRVVTPTGLQATTDKYGRYHITCAIVPNDSRGSNFVLKLDDRTLPGGYRMTTDQVQIQRATSGKALQANFGASIHRVVSIDLLDAAFEPGKTEIRDLWRPRINLLLEELRKAPAVLRLSYVADTEDAALVKRRVEAIKRELTERWGPSNDSYVLTIEPEVFWRRGAPPKQPEVRVPESK